MTEQPGFNPNMMGATLSPRETAAWELALGLPITQFPESYATALAYWKVRKDEGNPVTIDQALDASWAEIATVVQGPGAAVDPTAQAAGPTQPRPQKTGTKG